MKHPNSHCHIGGLSNKVQAKHFAPAKLVLDVPTKHCNTAMPANSWKPQPWSVRAGADDHQQYKSRGV